MEVIENDSDQEQHSAVEKGQDDSHSDSCHKGQKDTIDDDCDKGKNFTKSDSCDNAQEEVVGNGSNKNEECSVSSNVDSNKDSLKNSSVKKDQESVVDSGGCKNLNEHKKEDALKTDFHKEQLHSAKKDNHSNRSKNDSAKSQQNKEEVNSDQAENKAIAEKKCALINEESNSSKEHNAKATKEDMPSSNDSNNQSLGEESDENSSKLPDIKEESTENSHKLHEVSQILRKRRSRNRERVHSRHRSSSKDIAKLLRKKRSLHKQQSTGSHQEEDSSTHSGTKRKRIPNRPGISFEVGARIEAKDYLDKWYPSKIIAVDEDAAEVLIHFERWSARFDEWMPMESPRIRAITHPSTRNEQKEKTNKIMPQYKAGEAVLARWTDCKMYPAKVVEVGANDSYEVLFYDGFHRTVQSLNIEKIPKGMSDKVDFPPVVKSESPERKKSNPLPKDVGKPPPKKVDKSTKDRTPKRDQNDLTSILGKRKRLIVGGIFQAKRNKMKDEKSNLSTKQKCKKTSLPINETNVETATPNKDVVETVPSVAPVGYIDGRKIARKEFIIEEDHNHFKCPVPSCGKSFRKDKLLQSHMKHYHCDTRNREKKKTLPQDLKTAASASTNTAVPAPEKVTGKEESKAEVLKTRLKSPVKEEVAKEIPKANNEESVKSGKTLKSPRIDPKNSKTATSVPETTADNKANAVRTDGRVTRSEKSPRSEQKSPRLDSKATRAETRSYKQEGKLAKTDKTEARVPKTENKALKADNNKVIKNESKSAKTDSKLVKSENKIIKAENKPAEEKPEKSKLGQENKMVGSTVATQQLPVAEDTKSADNVTNTITIAQTPVLPVENGHVSRSKKRRTTSSSEVNADISTSVDNNTHPVILKETDIKTEQKQVDMENIHDDVKPPMTDLKPIVQEEEPDESQNDEIVHCICNCIEETGLMMQCEVCLTWQHGACFDIEDVKEVPDKYVCYACLKPVGLRESFRYRHDLDWFNKGEMATFSFLDEKPSPNAVNEMLSAHDLIASLHNATSVLHSLQIKLRLANEDNHPDLIMWKKPWMDYSYLHCQENDNNEVLVQPTRADFDHSYFSVKEENVTSTNALNTRGSYDKMSKRDNMSRTAQGGESSQSFDRSKDVSSTKCKVNDRERVDCKQQGLIKTEKVNIEFDPSECKKNLLDHIIQMQCAVEHQLNVIEEHLQVLESEMGIPTLSEEDLEKQMGKSLFAIRKLMKDLSLVQQLTYFQ